MLRICWKGVPDRARAHYRCWNVHNGRFAHYPERHYYQYRFVNVGTVDGNAENHRSSTLYQLKFLELSDLLLLALTSFYISLCIFHNRGFPLHSFYFSKNFLRASEDV